METSQEIHHQAASGGPSGRLRLQEDYSGRIIRMIIRTIAGASSGLQQDDHQDYSRRIIRTTAGGSSTTTTVEDYHLEHHHTHQEDHHHQEHPQYQHHHQLQLHQVGTSTAAHFHHYLRRSKPCLFFTGVELLALKRAEHGYKVYQLHCVPG